MKNDYFSKLSELCELPAPTGKETKVLQFISSVLSNYMEVSSDQVGNVVGELPGRSKKKQVVIVAHADEIGYVIRSIDPNGFLHLSFNTGATVPDTRFLPGERLRVLTDTDREIIGIVGLTSGHLAGKKGKKELLTLPSLYLDVGANSTKEIQEDYEIQIGNPAVFERKTEFLGKNNHLVMGKAMDDRTGILVLLEIAKRMAEYENHERPTLKFIFTIQEEIGVKGAPSSALQLRDTKAQTQVIALDVGPVGDTPGAKDLATPKLNQGPIIVFKDSEMHYDRKIIHNLLEISEKKEIPTQRSVYANYGSDALGFLTTGFPSALVAVPCRYTHTPFETISIRDLQDVIELVFGFIKQQ